MTATKRARELQEQRMNAEYGEESCVVLAETKVGNTAVVAERMGEPLAANRFEVGSDSTAATASISIAGIDSIESEATLSPAMLIDRADQALYSAKHPGRNRVEMWDALMQGGELLH